VSVDFIQPCLVSLHKSTHANTHAKKSSKDYPICSNRQGQQVVNVNQYPEQKPLSLSFGLSEWRGMQIAQPGQQTASHRALPLLPSTTSANSNVGGPSTSQHVKRGSRWQRSSHARPGPTAVRRTDGRTGPPRSEARPVPLALTIGEDNCTAFLPSVRKTHSVERRKRLGYICKVIFTRLISLQTKVIAQARKSSPATYRFGRETPQVKPLQPTPVLRETALTFSTLFTLTLDLLVWVSASMLWLFSLLSFLEELVLTL